jgi:methylated-DNA-[protein]-cysteine S-methyltransferase
MPIAVERDLYAMREAAPPEVADFLFSEAGMADSLMYAHGPIGEVAVAYNEYGVAGAALIADLERFADRHRRLTGRGLFEVTPAREFARQIRVALETGDARKLAFDLRKLSPFFRAVLRATLTIPSGEFRSYRWVAAKAGNERAMRAAGNALAANPIPLLIPCHRVVRTDGHIGNYGMGGPAVKRKLLRLEGALV